LFDFEIWSGVFCVLCVLLALFFGVFGVLSILSPWVLAFKQICEQQVLNVASNTGVPQIGQMRSVDVVVGSVGRSGEMSTGGVSTLTDVNNVRTVVNKFVVTFVDRNRKRSAKDKRAGGNKELGGLVVEVDSSGGGGLGGVGGGGKGSGDK
jgi:hypothetical protein